SHVGSALYMNCVALYCYCKGILRGSSEIVHAQTSATPLPGTSVRMKKEGGVKKSEGNELSLLKDRGWHASKDRKSRDRTPTELTFILHPTPPGTKGSALKERLNPKICFKKLDFLLLSKGSKGQSNFIKGYIFLHWTEGLFGPSLLATPDLSQKTCRRSVISLLDIWTSALVLVHLWCC
ncbi:hypothetical protein IRJ41_015012, partial [Triplophysa rosa]